MRRLIDVGLALGYAGLIFFLSAQSKFPVPPGVWSFDKLLHGVEYAILAVLIARAMRHLHRRTIGFSLLLASLYGVSDELHQSFVPGRLADGYDVLADVGGAGMGGLAFWLHSRRRSRAT